MREGEHPDVKGVCVTCLDVRTNSFLFGSLDPVHSLWVNIDLMQKSIS